MPETNTIPRLPSDFPFETLISFIKSRKDQKKILKSLYVWLTYWSLSDDSKRAVGSDDFMLNSGYLRTLSITLFEELCERLLVKIDDASIGQSPSQATLEVSSHCSIEELLLLLRCCMVSLNGLENDQDLLLDKSRCLLEMLHIMFASSKLSRKLFDHEICATLYADDFAATFSVTKSSELYPPSLRRMLEVFIDELLVQRNLRKSLVISESCHPRRENILSYKATDIGCVLEAIFAHFLVSVSGFHGFGRYIRNLLCLRKGNCPTPEISLTSAVTLLLNPAIASAPPLILAHLISLVSEVITANIVFENIDLNMTTLNCYFHSFEWSVSLYHSHISKLDMHDLSLDATNLIAKPLTPGRGHPSSFWSHFGPKMNDGINTILEEIDCSLGTSSHHFNTFSGIKCNMVAAFTEYVKENLCIIEESCRDIAFSFLSFIITEVSGEADGSCKNENLSMEEVYVLASILKLMSSSMLQAVGCLRKITLVMCPQTCVGSPLCKEHDFLVRIINSFKAYKMCMPIQELLVDSFGAQLKYNGSKLMLVHLAGLLSFCLAHGLEFMAKGCLSVMMVVMNLLFFEEGSLDFLSRLANPVSNSCSTKSPPSSLTSVDAGYASSESDNRIQRGCAVRKSSLAMASHFKVIQNIKLSSNRRSNFYFHEEGSKPEALETVQALDRKEKPDVRKGGRRTRERFNWDKCDSFISEDLSSMFNDFDDDDVDVDDIDSFLECEPNFSRWLNAHVKFREWRSKRRAMQARERIKARWRGLKRSRNTRQF